MSDEQKLYIVTVESQNESFDVPIYANNLDEATELAEFEYAILGLISRVRPEVKSNTTH